MPIRSPAPAWLLFLTVALLSAGGCQVSDHLTIRPDGSGTVQITTILDGDASMLLGYDAWRAQMGDRYYYPPLSDTHAQKLFPGEGFEVNTESSVADGKTTTNVTVQFKDINQLLQSPYAAAHSLTLAKRDDRLVLQAKSGAQALAHFDSLPDDELSMAAMMGDAIKRRHAYRVAFRVTLPGAVEAEGAAVAGNDATWTVDRAALADAEAGRAALARPMAASCGAHGVTFDPVSPPRLDLVGFDQLTEGQAGAEAAMMDAGKVIAAAKVVPAMVKVKRSFDISGEGHSSENSTELVAVVVLPRELEPQRWGEPTITTATDDTGADLRLAVDDDNFRMHRSVFSHYSSFGDDEGAEPTKDAQHIIQLTMKPADRRAKAIAKVTGTLPLHYPGTPHIVKAPNAVPSIAGEDGGVFHREQGPLSSPSLAKHGVKLTLQHASHQQGMLQIMFQTDDDSTPVMDVVVFDKDGKPWPTARNDRMSGESFMNLSVMGKPQPPLSLGMIVGSGGSKVEVPLVFTALSITPNDAKPTAEAP